MASLPFQAGGSNDSARFAVKEIVLSRVVTGQFKDVRQRAVNNVVRLGLIRVRRRKGEAVRVTRLYL